MNASALMARRYIHLIDGLKDPDPMRRDPEMSRPHLIWMCQIITNHAHVWPKDKTGRWLGFVQGVLACQRVITVPEEREFSRGLFNGEYAEDGIALPGTFSR